jgi:hypothetical protein
VPTTAQLRAARKSTKSHKGSRHEARVSPPLVPERSQSPVTGRRSGVDASNQVANTRKAFLTVNDATAAPSSDDDGSEKIAEALIGLLAGHADATRVAGVVVRTWIDIESALSPVLGKRGVAALYKRSLHLSGPGHGCLAALEETSTSAIDFEMLQQAFVVQSNVEATSAAAAMLKAFCKLLVSLVGPALTRRLLSPLLTSLQAGHPPEAS